jgi:hypothetical protein
VADAVLEGMSMVGYDIAASGAPPQTTPSISTEEPAG